MQPVVVLHSDPDEIRAVFEERIPDVPIEFATEAGQVQPVLERLAPECVFSIKHDGFPGPGHRPVIDHPSVRWVHVGGSGFEHLEPWDPQRITVTNCAGLLAPFLAETVTGAMLALNSHLIRYAAQQPRREWLRFPFTPLAGRTLLVVGVGHIGGHVARNARALGMHVLGTRRRAEPHPDVDEVHATSALPELLGRADFVSLHVRLNEETRHLIDAKALARMRPGSFLLNTARGPVVDESALVDAVRGGHLAGAYLDVFETEPLPTDSPLWDLPNVLLTPHTSDNVTDWPARYAGLFADNLKRRLAGEPLHNVVGG